MHALHRYTPKNLPELYQYLNLCKHLPVNKQEYHSSVRIVKGCCVPESIVPAFKHYSSKFSFHLYTGFLLSLIICKSINWAGDRESSLLAINDITAPLSLSTTSGLETNASTALRLLLFYLGHYFIRASEYCFEADCF